MEKQGQLFFVYGHGGTGKTFLYKTIMAKLRSIRKIVLAVASSGIASLLLPGGRTAHSRFDIPIELFQNSTCGIRPKSNLVELIQKAHLIIWDEAPMAHKFAFEAVDKSFRDIMSFKNIEASEKPFGGKTVLLGGDFRQTLSVIATATRQEIVQASLNRSYIWDHTKVFILSKSMRINDDGENGTTDLIKKEFNQWIIDIGDGKADAISRNDEDHPTWIKIPQRFLIDEKHGGVQSIFMHTYPNFHNNMDNEEYLKERAILTPLKETVDEVNDYITKMTKGDFKLFRSSDEISKESIENEEQLHMYPTEYLNSLNLSGMPNHLLKLKVGMLVMLLRNLNPSLGLCNGTRLTITQLEKHVIEGKILTGSTNANRVLILRITITSTNPTLPFTMKRRQYPLKPCYAMTINKSQGQSLKTVGLYLPKSVFCHGQLYIAVSRVTNPQGLKILVEEKDPAYEGYTRNSLQRSVQQPTKD